MKKNIVVIGGGNGTAVTLQACKTFDEQIELSAIVSMSDSGGANGRLREQTGFLPASDIMRTTLALSNQDARQLKQVFYRNRVKQVDPLVDGYYIGLLWYTLMQQQGLSFTQAQRAFEQIVAATGQAHPVTLELSDLCVELENGDILKTEGVIDRPKDRDHRIRNAWLEPHVPISADAQAAIQAADIIIFGPGSLYCSIVTNLLVDGMREALEKSDATLIYVVGNAYETIGEAGPETLSEFVSEMEHYLPRRLDTIVYNNHTLSKEEEAWYKEKQWALITNDEDQMVDSHIVSGDYERAGGLDPEKLGTLLKQIIFV